MGIAYRLSTCKYCGKKVRWIKSKNGKYIPCDPGQICYRIPGDGKGSLTLVTQEGKVISAEKESSSNAEGVAYISHFATCENYKKEG